MQLRELRLFARTDGGARLAANGIRALRLPMPDDVLEQFVLDHGLNPDFQSRYGDLNLYDISWSQESLHTSQIAQCTSKFDDYVGEIAERHALATSLEAAVFHKEAHSSWSNAGTWLRSPIFFLNVFPPPDSFHLVEGHTRVGALIGFQRNSQSPVQLAPTHSCWVGRPITHHSHFDWKEVRRKHPLSFKQWIYDAAWTDGPRAALAKGLFDAEDKNRYVLSVGERLEDLVELILRVPVPELSVVKLKELHLQWQHAVGIDLPSPNSPTKVST